MLMDVTPAPLQQWQLPELAAAGIEVWVKRLDLSDATINGNKPYKLQPNIAEAMAQGKRGIASCGGPWSNHIHALAAAGNKLGISTAGFIRMHANSEKTAMMADARAWGMELIPVSPTQYRSRNGAQLLAEFAPHLSAWQWIPEGGANEAGVLGCESIMADIYRQRPQGFDQLWLPVGTGATLAGLVRGCRRNEHIVGVPVLTRCELQRQAIDGWLTGRNIQASWELLPGYEFGGYAKFNQELVHFIRHQAGQTHLPLEPVYTGKLFYALYQQVVRGSIARGSRVLALHTGGLQGARGTWSRQRQLAPLPQ